MFQVMGGDLRSAGGGRRDLLGARLGRRRSCQHHVHPGLPRNRLPDHGLQQACGEDLRCASHPARSVTAPFLDLGMFHLFMNPFFKSFICPGLNTTEISLRPFFTVNQLVHL